MYGHKTRIRKPRKSSMSAVERIVEHSSSFFSEVTISAKQYCFPMVELLSFRVGLYLYAMASIRQFLLISALCGNNRRSSLYIFMSAKRISNMDRLLHRGRHDFMDIRHLGGSQLNKESTD